MGMNEEQNIIACMFQSWDTAWVDLIMDSVTEDMFTDTQTAKMFQIASKAIKSHGTASQSLIDGEYAKDLSKWMGGIYNPESSISYVLANHKRRKIAEYCDTATTELMRTEPDEVLRQLSTKLDSLNRTLGGDPKPASHYLRSLIEQINDTERVFINSGIADFDVFMKGFQAGQMIVIAGRPAQGKSVLGAQIALHNAVNGRPVLMFNFEMSGEEIVGRIIAGELGINSERIANRELSESQMRQLSERPDLLDDVPLYIDPDTSHTLSSIRSLARKYKRLYNIGAIVIDYLQLIGEEKDRGENREQLVARMSRSLKVLAKELEIPVIILAQLSRESDKTATKEPELHHLRESGAIEQDADVVIFVHRPEYYGIETFDDGSSTHQCIIVKVAKRRNGPISRMRLRFNAPDQRIENL
jgi:replicative DNA helicase